MVLQKIEFIKESFWGLFRIIFVVFSLYLLGDAFYQWDGFRYYGTFSDFLPGIALELIILSIIAVISTIFIWLLFKIVEWGCLQMERKIRIEHLLMFIAIFIFLGALVWKGRFLIKHYIMVTELIKLIIAIAIAIISILLTALFRNKAVSWLSIVQERITPLVWLFGVLVILSIPVVVYQIVNYHPWRKEYREISTQISKTSLVNKNQPNIILVTFDALTARNMSLYGYNRKTTPFIDEWAKNASVFTRAEAESNYTSPTTASLMTGKRVWTHQLYQPHGYNLINADTENFPLLLKNNGYYNIALIQNSFASVQTLGISDAFGTIPLLTEFMEPASIDLVIQKYLFLLFGNKFHLYNRFVRGAFILSEILDRRRCPFL